LSEYLGPLLHDLEPFLSAAKQVLDRLLGELLNAPLFKQDEGSRDGLRVRLQSIEVPPSPLAGVLDEGLKQESEIGLDESVRVLFAALSHHFEEVQKLVLVLAE
jgi:hypothetical protein